ncbi:DUF6443 domain-containing protein [Mucilaginibacter sp. AK015]|uniref:DUF6443 domain-containing protein n=1 Tax=Mucilaginibacter sp. AK015 TaxID=2723072 RepID=UPI001614ED7B|nr:DUF6443 domain-containing protein [Mucilaginibacter sp. AK015]MBB5395087.1 RHS repeat-associated protein [Mucilaginibacter sp. AK015]
MNTLIIRNHLLPRIASVLLLLQWFTAKAQEENYLRTRIPLSPVATVAGVDANASNPSLVQTDFVYYDLFGRTKQTVGCQQSFTGKDVIHAVEYDLMGREAKQWLPYTFANPTPGAYRPAGTTETASFYAPGTAVPAIATTNVPFSITTYDGSPLARVTEQSYAGETWQTGSGHTVKTSYGTNAANEVRKWTVSGTGASYAMYPAGKLLGTTITNENGYSVTQYKDLSGNMVCKKVQAGAALYLYTDYLYDDFNNLRYVVPPLPTLPAAVPLPSSFSESDPLFANFLYGYHYDGRGRMTEKKIPGKGWEYFVYNKADQVVLSQTPSQLALGVWAFFKFDAQGHTVMTGTLTSASNRTALQATAESFAGPAFEAFTNTPVNYGYSDNSYPDNTLSAAKEIWSVSYYDGYDFLSNAAINPNTSVFTAPAADNLYRAPSGLATGTLYKVIGAPTSTYLLSISHYDLYGRNVKTITQSFKQGSTNAGNYDVAEQEYNFSGQVTKSTRLHYVSSVQQLNVVSWNNYNAGGQKTSVQQKINTGAVYTPVAFEYNELGRLKTKHLHSASSSATPPLSGFFQHVDYRYNNRGWLTSINDPGNLSDPVYGGQDLFAEQIDYESPSSLYTPATPQYNGNISSISWQSLAKSPMVQERRGYVYSYDAMNRLTGAGYRSPSGNDKFSEAITYDELGNILTLNRNITNSTTFANKLSYNYGAGSQRSNALKSVSDLGTEGYNATFAYHSSGNEASDSKLISSIQYNAINLPSLITLVSGKTIKFCYTPTGTKLEKVTANAGGGIIEDRSYISGIEYNANTLESFYNEEGRVIKNGTLYKPEYSITDHLGSPRAVFGDDGNGVFSANDILQITDYYAFGKQIAYLDDTGPVYPYKFSNKEYSADINGYDFGARLYNQSLSRWNNVDNEAESSRRWSPYSYTYNNPVRNVDPDGQSVFDVIPSVDEFARYLIYRDWTVAKSDMWKPTTSAWDQGLNNFYGFMVHLTPFGGIVDFTNAARKGDVGGAMLGLATTASFFVSDFILPENPATYVTEEGFANWNTIDPVLGAMAKQEGTASFEAARFEKYLSDPTDMAGKMRQWKVNQENSTAMLDNTQTWINNNYGEGTTTLYRNFGPNEYKSIRESGGFSISENNYAGKQFWIGESGLDFWMQTQFQKQFTVKLTIPTSFVTPGNPNYLFSEYGHDLINNVPHVDGYPGGTISNSTNLSIFNSAMTINWFQYR